MQLQMQGHKSIQNLCPLLLLVLNAFSLSNPIHNSQLILVCPNNVWAVKQGAKLKAEVFVGRGNQQQAEHPMEIDQIIYLRHNQVSVVRSLKWQTSNSNCCGNEPATVTCSGFPQSLPSSASTSDNDGGNDPWLSLSALHTLARISSALEHLV